MWKCRARRARRLRRVRRVLCSTPSCQKVVTGKQYSDRVHSLDRFAIENLRAEILQGVLPVRELVH